MVAVVVMSDDDILGWQNSIYLFILRSFVASDLPIGKEIRDFIFF